MESQPAQVIVIHRALSLIALVGLALVGCARKPPPSVLFVTFDTTRYDHIGADGDPEAKTPTVDALAAEGLTFDHAYASVALTLPSHTTMLSGLEPIEHGVHTNGKFRVPGEVQTLPETLRAAGYETAAFVSAFVLDAQFNLDQGFDVYDDRTTRKGGALNMGVPTRPGDEVADRALEWLEGRSAAKPFFLWTHFYDPHHPLEPPPPYDKMPSAYAAEIAFADSQLARVLAKAREQAGARGLLVVFTADHGESLGEHEEKTHGILAYDSTLHVPLIVAGPGVPRGARSKAYVRHIDLVPTLLRRLGEPTPAELKGRNLLALANATADPDDGVLGYFESRGPHFDLGWHAIEGVRTARWKYTAAPAPPELFDVLGDPREVENLIDKEPEVAREMEARWQDFREMEKALVGAKIADASLDAAEQLAALGYVQAPQEFDAGEIPDPRRFARIHTWIDEARSEAQDGRFRQAIEILETLRESQSVKALVLRTLAPIYGEMGRTDESLRAYEEYIQLTGAAEAKLGLARVQLDAGRYEDVLKTLEDVPSVSPRVLTLRSYSLARLGRLDEARAEIERARRGPRLARARRHLWAGLVIDSAPIPDGEAELRRLLGEDPEDPDIRSRLGYYLAVWGPKEKGEEALSLLKSAAEARPTDPNLASNLGWGAYRVGNDEVSLAGLEKALEIDPARQLDRFRLAYPLRRRGDRNRAVQALRHALTVQPAASWAKTARELLADIEQEIARLPKSAEQSRGGPG